MPKYIYNLITATFKMTNCTFQKDSEHRFSSIFKIEKGKITLNQLNVSD